MGNSTVSYEIKEAKIKSFSKEERQRMFNRIEKAKWNKTLKAKYKFLFTILLDAGLRISECLELRMGAMKWDERKIIVHTKKQRKSRKDETRYDTEKTRTIYMTQRIVSAAGEYFKYYTNHDINSFVFPSEAKSSESGHLSAVQAWRVMARFTDKTKSPHAARHSFAVDLLDNGASIVEVSQQLGHVVLANTLIYARVTEEKKRTSIEKLEQTSKWNAFFKKYFPFFFKSPTVGVLPSYRTKTKYRVGRKTEIATLNDLYDKRVNCLLIGEQGVGKSHLIDAIDRPNLLRIDDTKDFKKQIAACIFKLIDNTEEFKDRIENNPVTTKDGAIDADKTRHAVILDLLGLDKSVISTQSAKRLCEILCQITEKNEYTIAIDRADDVTPTVIKQLEFLTTHFHFVVAARSIAVKNATWLHNFQKVKIEPLSRSEAIELIRISSNSYRDKIENLQLFETHILNKSQNVPLRILDMTERFGKETFVSAAMVANYEVVGDMREIDMSWFILIGLSGFMIMRYIGGELGHDEDAFRLFGAFGLLFAFFARSFFRFSKRRYV